MNIMHGIIDTCYHDIAVFRRRLCKMIHWCYIKLKRYGFTGRLYNWLEDYLKNRKQRVVLEGAQSEYEDIIAGVPQGSILGPLLFLIYVNDLPTNITTNIRIYAADTSLFADNNPKQGSEMLQQDINQIEKWAGDWLMEFNLNHWSPQERELNKLQK